MRNIFLDNQSLIYIFENIDSPDAHYFSQLNKQREITVVLSLENLIEFSKSGTIEQAIELTQAVLTCVPKWIDSFFDIQKQEIHKFIYSEYLKKISQEYNPYKNNFSELFHDEIISPLDLTISPLDFVKAAFDPNQKNMFNLKWEQHAGILTELQQHRKYNRITKEIEEITLRNVIVSRLPEKELYQLGFTHDDKLDLLRFCLKNKNNFYKSCPSLNTERHLSCYRSLNPKRKPQLSDSIDLTMSIAVFPYVDVFITNDGFLYDGLKYVSKNVRSIQTEIFKRIYEYSSC
uniref:hypothetical protein n=1 Tax=Candidatus Electronema sp. TaxID=2698783 RepID=UPI0040572FE3